MTISGPVRAALVLALASAVSACGGDDTTGSAEDYPTESIRFLVPYAAGGPTDHTSRTVASCLQEELGQPVVVENRPGASGALGTTDLIGSAPDGHTLALITAGTTVLTPLDNEVGYTKDDVTPIGVMAEVPSLLAAGQESRHQDAQSFFDAARAEPDSITVGVPGASTPQAIELQRLADEHDIVVNVIPFDGNAEMTTALLGGNVDAVLINASADVVSNVEAGSFIPLAASPAERLSWLPDTPTLEELGFDGLTLSGSTFGLAGPADLPDEITTTLEDMLRTCLDKPDVRETLGERYVPEEFVDADGLQQILDDTQEVYEPILGEA
jgi:tripartite-type tricarboxylate transporter receptor subunit TctC